MTWSFSKANTRGSLTAVVGVICFFILQYINLPVACMMMFIKPLDFPLAIVIQGTLVLLIGLKCSWVVRACSFS